MYDLVATPDQPKTNGVRARHGRRQGILPGLPPVAGKPVHLAFDGGLMTSDAGILLLAALEQRLGIAERLADCIEDPRVRTGTAYACRAIRGGAAQPDRDRRPVRRLPRGRGRGLEELSGALRPQLLATASRPAARPAELSAYADRVVIRQDGEIVGEHAAASAAARPLYDPWHYVPVLAKKPGALRNGDPFSNWHLPAGAGAGAAADRP